MLYRQHETSYVFISIRLGDLSPPRVGIFIECDVQPTAVEALTLISHATGTFHVFETGCNPTP